MDKETDEEIEDRIRTEMSFYTLIVRLRIPGPYEIAALLRLLDKRDMENESLRVAQEQAIRERDLAWSRLRDA